MGVGGGGQELAPHVQVSTLTATGAGAAIGLCGDFNASVWGSFVATVQLERSFDGGTNWLPCTRAGVPVAFSLPFTDVVSEPEAGVLYRLNCTSYTSGTAHVRLSQ